MPLGRGAKRMVPTRVKAALARNPAVQILRDAPYVLRRKPPYSQHGEDSFLVSEVFRDVPEPGTYVDIGASHPIRISNTYLFYRMGWSGITVEPLPSLASLHRFWRPRDTLVQATIGEEDGVSTLYWLYPPVLSTTSESIMKRRITGNAVLLDALEMPQLTLHSLLVRRAGPGPVDFMSIDVEGADALIAAQVAKLPPDSRPFAICIEGNDDAAKEAIDDHLAGLYHDRQEFDVNTIFWRPVPGGVAER